MIYFRKLKSFSNKIDLFVKFDSFFLDCDKKNSSNPKIITKPKKTFKNFRKTSETHKKKSVDRDRDRNLWTILFRREASYGK